MYNMINTRFFYPNKRISEIYSIYREEGRHYHTLRHVFSMQYNAEDFKLSSSDSYKLDLAILFHDVVYNPKSKYNEKDSVSFFKQYVSEFELSEEEIKEIEDMILITAHTQTPKTKLEKIICDLDLQELGTDRWKEKSKNIRKEFNYLSDEEWKKGRREFLNFMLSKKNIFHTKLYKDRYEKQARMNIKKELSILN